MLDTQDVGSGCLVVCSGGRVVTLRLVARVRRQQRRGPVGEGDGDGLGLAVSVCARVDKVAWRPPDPLSQEMRLHKAPVTLECHCCVSQGMAAA